MKAFEKDILANDYDWLFTKYVLESLSVLEISNICETTSDSIRTRLKRFEIEIRNRESANKISNISKPRKYKLTEKNKTANENKKTGKFISCQNCLNLFYVTKKKIGTNKFCCRKCFLDYKKSERYKNNQEWREYPEYGVWRKFVYERDYWKCVVCSSKIKINAHHILEGRDYPDARFLVENGITLCEKHHIMLHKKPRSFIKELIKQTSNIGEHPEVDNPEASIKEILYALTTTKRYPERIMV